MTTMSTKKHDDAAQVKAISQKILANPELAGLIDELTTTADSDVNALVQGMIQASINRGLAADMDGHLGYERGDLATTADTGQTNSRNGSYPTTVNTSYEPIDIDALPRPRRHLHPRARTTPRCTQKSVVRTPPPQGNAHTTQTHYSTITCRQQPTLPPPPRGSTISISELSYRVRKGTGRTLTIINHRHNHKTTPHTQANRGAMPDTAQQTQTQATKLYNPSKPKHTMR